MNMIQVIPTYNTKSRAFGWVQDPSNMRSLCDVVAIFDNKSAKHKELVNKIIPKLVCEEDGRGRLLTALEVTPLKITYSDLVGTSFTPRSSARCNGIVQATVKGQVRPFISDWPADNFVRWAHALGFVKYSYADDSFEITENGLALAAARAGSDELAAQEKVLLIDAILAYPPAIRILTLLSTGAHLTKFEIGRAFGFVGESGFTNLPQDLLIKALADTKDAKERNNMKADWEGSADKYARMIAKWLEKLGLVEQAAKEVTATVAGKEYKETIGQAYSITAAGLTAFNRALGKSKHKRIAKKVCFEMLATNAPDRDYLRTRRAYLIKFLSEGKKPLSIAELVNMLSIVKLDETVATVEDDIWGLINIGLNIAKSKDGYRLEDLIEDFVIPLSQELAKSSLSDLKDELRQELDCISHEYLSLVDLAYDSTQNRLFEMNTIELLTKECAFEGMHLGGSRKPDGIVYTKTLPKNYGIIIDTKAYSKGYSLPISQADEMERYIRENQTRSKEINAAEWWKNFGADVSDFYFMFVSGHFTGNYTGQLERISKSTGINGTAMAVKSLLLCANACRKGELGHAGIGDRIVNNEFGR